MTKTRIYRRCTLFIIAEQMKQTNKTMQQREQKEV